MQLNISILQRLSRDLVVSQMVSFTKQGKGVCFRGVEGEREEWDFFCGGKEIDRLHRRSGGGG